MPQISSVVPSEQQQPEEGVEKIQDRVLPTANPRRTFPSTRTLDPWQEGRKRQKLSHSPDKNSRLQHDLAGNREVPGVLRGQSSGSSEQSANKWFDVVKKRGASGQQHPSELEDDPPFYMTSHPNYCPPDFAALEHDRRFGRTGHSRIDSENEDLRGVIDDLTLENKRLKQTIRKQISQHKSTPSDVSQQEKLFDVRMHGLSSKKRRELESLLKNFATGIHTSHATNGTSVSNTSASSSSRNLAGSKVTAPKTDSGYGSMANSGGLSSIQSQTRGVAKTQSSSNRDVKSYLRDIPDTLLPRPNPVMSERAKQALVVRRLEQLFTGRNAVPGDHDQPLQQQEIAKSAAQADRALDFRNNRKRKAEGTREARVMPPESRVNLDTLDCVEGKENSPLPKLWRDVSNSEQSPVSRSPDQRPTRPLDLDIDRALVPSENIQYIRHLGLSWPQFAPMVEEDNENPWMYLNLLTGLAQLHTLNVTPEFVRKAIKKLSKRFDVSKDGYKVRWIGGANVTKFSNADEKAIEVANTFSQEADEHATAGDGSSKTSNTNSISNADVTTTMSEERTSGLLTSSGSKLQQMTASGISEVEASSVPTKPTAKGSAFDYKPIILYPRNSHDNVDSDESLDSGSADSNGLVQALNRSDLNRTSKDEGLLTFYNNPYFCSDFSKDNEPSNMKSSRSSAEGEILGIPIPADTGESSLRHHDATYFTMRFAPRPFNEDLLSEAEKTKFNASLPKLPCSSRLAEAGEHETVPLEFEVSGLGGVTPQDNFALDVKLWQRVAPVRGPDMVVRRLPFSRRRYVQRYIQQIKSCDKFDLLPSKLPPPSYIFFTSSSSSCSADLQDGSDESEQSSSPSVVEEFPAPPAFMQQSSGSSGGTLSDDNDDEMDSEIDMLAIARRLNPQQVAEQEREYLINQPGGVQRAAAGSLAATVGASRSSASVLGVAATPSSVSSRCGSNEDNTDDDNDDEEDEDNDVSST